ncbi:MAG: alkaline phosphatase family protein [Oscillospiraceae bacterium]|nr:alkaline phosphatase family protein [Oscillospiraceae bacterium]
MYNSIRLTGLAAAFADGLGVERPKFAEPPIPALANLIGKVDRIFLYNPDGLGLWHLQKYTEWFAPLQARIQLALPLIGVMPTVTPVNFASIYTGAPPKVHGIQTYERPVIKIDTIFDAVIRAGKKCAIVTNVHVCSMSEIFREREMDYFTFGSEEYANTSKSDLLKLANEKAMQLIGEDKYDLLCVYNGNYDSVSHATWPESEESLAAMRDNITAFAEFAAATEKHWAKHRTLIGFAPDHGHHRDEITGRGTHGTDLEEDINIIHFYGIQP